MERIILQKILVILMHINLVQHLQYKEHGGDINPRKEEDIFT